MSWPTISNESCSVCGTDTLHMNGYCEVCLDKEIKIKNENTMKKPLRVETSDGWKTISLIELCNYLYDHPHFKPRVAAPCNHQLTVYNGIERCHLCGDVTEITSYRD
jgi:NAD-dependent dihydropyrimidine dehydrogenase PreA subunit